MNKKITYTFAALAAFVSIATIAHASEQHANHQSDHSQHGTKSTLTEAGNDAFGTLQEALQQLLADPKTDWSKVNMEGLRQHLADMRNFTLDVNVLKQTPIKKGIEIILSPNNKQVSESLVRVFAAHPAQLKNETGWDMKTYLQGSNYKITVTAKKPSDVLKIQGLGYIGVMSWGNHHQAHHWMMAKGGNPH